MRALWYGRLASEAIDAVVSAQAMRDLSQSMTLVVPPLPGFAVYPTYSRTTSEASLLGYATPQAMEQTAMYRPVAHSWIGYMAGFFVYDSMQHALVSSLPRVGLRPLSELSKRRLMMIDASEHIIGATEWTPWVARGANMLRAASVCSTITYASIAGAQGPMAVGLVDGYQFASPTWCQPYLPLPVWTPSP